MKNNGKRLLALLLCMVMCISLLPVTALAEEGEIVALEEGTITAAEDDTDELRAEEVQQPEVTAEEDPDEAAGTDDPENADHPVRNEGAEKNDTWI